MIVGIDLGTTNSLIGSFSDNGPVLYPNPLGHLLTPSVVSIDESGGVMIGEGARDRLITHPNRSVAAFKRWMGSPRETALAGRAFRPEELSSLVIRSLVADAEAATGNKVVEAVISVPAYFSDAQRKATKIAGEMAGIRVDRLINEPTAAALAYGLEHRPEGGRFLVFDLGGGTLDVSILDMFDGVVEVRASAGDNYLGGEDFLDALVDAALADLKLDPAKVAPGDFARLRRKVEDAKRALSSSAKADVQMQIDGRTVTWTVDEERFALLVGPLVERMRTPLERALRDANLRTGELDEVVLVGGATRMPLVARTVTKMLGRLPLRHVNPDQAIALGAVIASGMKARNARLEEVILTDVCPYTLGTDLIRRDEKGTAHPGYFAPIIQRNSTVPVSRELEVWPAFDEQYELHVGVFQGENPVAAKNVKLGELQLDLPRGGPRQDRGVVVRYTYDINGLLIVNVRVKQTGQEHELVLQQNPGTLTLDEIRTRIAALAHLKVHPRAKQENLALIARAERLYEEQLHAREDIQAMLVQFQTVLESQDEKLIAKTRPQFSAALDRLDHV